MSHQTNQYTVRSPVAARSRLGAARRYRLKSPLGAARASPEKLDRTSLPRRLPCGPYFAGSDRQCHPKKHRRKQAQPESPTTHFSTTLKSGPMRKRPPCRHGYSKGGALASTKHCCRASSRHASPRIRSHLVDYVVRIGRRALEVAIKEAVSQKELNPRLSEWEPEWSHIADASQAADVALSKLFRAIDPAGKDAENFAPFIRQSRAGGVVASKAEYRDAAESALRDARLLVAAKQIIGKLRADTLTRRDALVALYPSSSQDHQKRAFVRILAEGWIFLTGEMPGKHPDPSKNPFLRVVDAAWIDWHQEDSSDAEAFGEALNAAISSIDDAQLNWLRAAGPGWLPGRV